MSGNGVRTDEEKAKPKPRALAVKNEVIPAWKDLMAELFPRPDAAARLADAHRSLLGKAAPKGRRHDSEATWFRRIIKRNDIRPQPHTTYIMARAMRTLDLEWFASPLALFAAGYFGEYIYLFQHVVSANALSPRRALDLVRNTEAALEPSPDAQRIADLERSAEEYQERARGTARTWRRTEALEQAAMLQQEADDLRAQAAARPERLAWILSDVEVAAFDHAWQIRNAYPRRKGGPPQPRPLAAASIPDRFLAAAALTEEHPDLTLQRQRDIAIGMLGMWLASKAR